MMMRNEEQRGAGGRVEDGYAPAAVALLRGLGRVSSGVPGYQNFVGGVCRSLPSAEQAAILLEQGNYRALSSTGKEAMRELQKAFERLLTFAYPTQKALKELDDALGYAVSLVEASENTLYESWDMLPDILGAKDCESFLSFHTELLHALSHLTAVNFGSELLAPLRDIELDALDSSYENLLVARKELALNVRGKAALGSWAVSQTGLGDGFFDNARGYVFSLMKVDVGDHVKQGLYRRAASNVYVSEGSSNEVVVGKGYLVGTDYRESYKLRDENVHAALPQHAFELTGFDIADPLGSVRAYFENDDAFCIHPEQLAIAMDRAERAKTVAASSSHACPICGRPATDALFCGSKRGR